MAPGCWFWARSCFSSVALSAVSLLCASPRAGSPTGLEPGSEGTGLVPVSFSGVNFLGLRSELEEMLQKVESWNVGGNKSSL